MHYDLCSPRCKAMRNRELTFLEVSLVCGRIPKASDKQRIPEYCFYAVLEELSFARR